MLNQRNWKVARHSVFTNFTADHFVTKCHRVNSSRNPISAACTWDSILSAIVKIGTNANLLAGRFALFESSLLTTTKR